MKIFTDGAATKNGSNKCNCGIGVYSTEFSISMSLDQCREKWSWIPNTNSNNVGELLAIYAALVNCQDKDVTIYSDSLYSINCVTRWYKNWQKNNWQTSKNENVKNREIIEMILEEKKKKNSVFFFHVNSHLKEPLDKNSDEHHLWYGNYMADKLATSSILSP